MNIVKYLKHLNRFYPILIDVFGFQVKDKIAVEKRIRQVTAVTTIAISFGFGFSIFNFFIPGMAPLGIVELIAVAIMTPASVLGRRAKFVTLAEDLVMLSTLFFCWGINCLRWYRRNWIILGVCCAVFSFLLKRATRRLVV